jgi:anti-anti-sigma factor
MPDPTVIRVERNENATVIHVLLDHLNEMNIEAVRTSVEEAGREAPQLPVILDMADVYFVVSFSLGVFVELTQQFKGRGQRLVLTNLQAPVRQVIAITRLDKLFEIQDDPAASPQ